MDIKDIYKKQVEYQNSIADKYDFNIDKLPSDITDGFSYHIQHLISEIGEVLEADKRWKNLRNNKFNIEQKKEEIADCFIVLMNIAIFSGIDEKELEDSIVNKIEANFKR